MTFDIIGHQADKVLFKNYFPWEPEKKHKRFDELPFIKNNGKQDTNYIDDSILSGLPSTKNNQKQIKIIKRKYENTSQWKIDQLKTTRNAKRQKR